MFGIKNKKKIYNLIKRIELLEFQLKTPPKYLPNNKYNCIVVIESKVTSFFNLFNKQNYIYYYKIYDSSSNEILNLTEPEVSRLIESKG